MNSWQWTLSVGLVFLIFWLFHVSSPLNVSSEVPIKEVVYSPVGVDCGGQEVMSWGKPSFDSDPAMQHMVGVGCAQDRQCERWPPKGTTSGMTECCLNLGVCVQTSNRNSIYIQ